MRGAASIFVGALGLGAAAGLIAASTRPLATDRADIQAIIGEINARLRETASAAQARAATLAELPRLGWAVLTDEATVRDLTADELGFKPRPYETIEIAQVAQGRAPLLLLRLPAGSKVAAPLGAPGLHLLTSNGELYVSAVAVVAARDRGEEIAGGLAVTERFDAGPITERLEAAGAGARLEGPEGTASLGGRPEEHASWGSYPVGPAELHAKLYIATPAPPPRITLRVTGIVLAILSVLSALMWWRQARRAPAAPPAPVPSPGRRDTVPRGIIPAAPLPARTKRNTLPGLPAFREIGAISAERSRDGTEEMLAAIDEAVDHLADARAPPPDLPDDEYQTLFDLFLAARRQCGEDSEDLEYEDFVAQLRETRERLFAEEEGLTEVRYEVAIIDGVASVRALTTP